MNTSTQDEEPSLAQIASRVAAAKRSDKDALWVGFGAGGLAFLLLGPLAAAWWAIIAIAAAFALAYRIAKVVLYRVRGLARLSLFGDLQAKTVSPQANEARAAPSAPAAQAPPEPRSALVPRLSFAPDVHPHEVLAAERGRAVTLCGGLPGTEFRDLPLGMFLFTQGGLAFLPEARGKLEELIGEIPAALAKEVAGELFETVKTVQNFHTAAELSKEPAPVAEWMATALRQKHHFVIAWGDLTGVMVGATHTVLSRETAEGAREDFIILDASRSWPSVLMQQRIMADLNEAVREFVLRPKYRALLPQVRAEMNAETPEAEIHGEAERRARAWFSSTKPAIGPTVKEAMAPALEGYSFIPKVVENQPWLFKTSA